MLYEGEQLSFPLAVGPGILEDIDLSYSDCTGMCNSRAGRTVLEGKDKPIG